MKVVSGGQTGVDRGALDAALSCGIDTGGWCPANRLAEDGLIPGKYPVTELPDAGYIQRTRQNVIDSDGTVVIYFSYPAGGTEQTIHFCIEHGKPYLLIDADEITVNRAATRIREFYTLKGIEVLNVAGPRASGELRAYDYARESLLRFLSSEIVSTEDVD
jgi:hypothetical protein